MKFLALVLALVMAVPPVQAGLCGSAAAGEKAGHATMHHGHGGHASSHDCCQPHKKDGAPECPGLTACTHCATVASLLPAIPELDSIPLASREPQFRLGHVTPGHTTLPFRPPKSIS